MCHHPSQSMGEKKKKKKDPSINTQPEMNSELFPSTFCIIDALVNSS